MRRLTPLVATIVLAAAAALPFTSLSKYDLHVANLIVIAAILAMSLDLLFGYLGQMSLAHAGFYGLGAYTAGLLTTSGLLPFWLATPAAMAVSAVVGGLLGWPAMRLTGFYLAMATMSFGIILSSLFVQSVSITGGPNGLLGIEPPTFFGTELIGPARGFEGNYFYLLLAAAFLTWLLLRRLTTGRLGRVIQSVRDSGIAAASLGVDVRLVQVGVFAVSCALASLAGSLYAHLLLYISPESFTFTNSLLALLGVVFGGIGTLWGPIVGAGLLTILGEALHGFGAYELIVYAGAICLVILAVPHGIAGLVRRRAPPAAGPAHVADTLRPAPVHKLPTGEPLLEIEGLGKRFGGVQALGGVSFRVREHEIKALIGPNGSGKTTLFNCVTGLLRPDGGTVRFAGRDIAGLPAHSVARTGVARSFQIVQLFGRMTVLENVLLAGQRRHPSSGLAALLGLPGAARADAANLLAAERLLADAGLSAWRHTPAANLPYGRQRVLEIARALATAPRLLMLDEPAAGLNTAEAFELADYLRRVQAGGVSILLVEHNMPFVLGLADSVTVLDQGRIIADGTPDAIGSDEAVINAYLGAPELEDA